MLARAHALHALHLCSVHELRGVRADLRRARHHDLRGQPVRRQPLLQLRDAGSLYALLVLLMTMMKMKMKMNWLRYRAGDRAERHPMRCVRVCKVDGAHSDRPTTRLP